MGALQISYFRTLLEIVEAQYLLCYLQYITHLNLCYHKLMANTNFLNMLSTADSKDKFCFSICCLQQIARGTIRVHDVCIEHRTNFSICYLEQIEQTQFFNTITNKIVKKKNQLLSTEDSKILDMFYRRYHNTILVMLSTVNNT